MSYLRGSANYVWCTTSVLGKGATGAVFQGCSKHDGEPVAVKTFNHLSHMRPENVQVREFEVLRKVKHENIVKLLAIEEEQDGRGKVIVMELCTGGSLYNLLDHPENTYGLCEDDFLLVLSHLSEGMKHLRDYNIVHRDLKPGNIMKYVAEDGRVIFKLTDFGAARELEEDQEFMSLYGTEEYLHPDMYERAVLRKPAGKTFSANVDLWSIGVTLYHVATGFLPFRPYGGRKNKEMMHYITTKKESGVISGCQTTENGPVEWKRDLPSSCQISLGLKLLVTPLLAGLMEADQRKRWTYDTFFSAVDRVLRRKIAHLFYVNKIQTLRIYVDPEEHQSLGSFQTLVQEQTDINPDSQILMFGDSNLTKYWMDAGCDAVISGTSESKPIVLCHRGNNNISLDWDTKDLPKFPSFPNLVNVENDASLAKSACAVGYCYKRKITKISLSVSLISVAVQTIVDVISVELRRISRDTSLYHDVMHCIGQHRKTMERLQRVLASITSSPQGTAFDEAASSRIKSLNLIADSSHSEFDALSKRLNSLEQPVKQLLSRFVNNGSLIMEWKQHTADLKDVSRAPKTAATHVTKLQDSWQHLLRDRATRSLTYNDEQFHILERIKMQEKSKCLSELLNEDCQSVLVRLTEVLSDWYNQAQAAFIQTEFLAKDVQLFQQTVSEFRKSADNTVESFQAELDQLATCFKTSTTQGSNRNRPTKDRVSSLSAHEKETANLNQRQKIAKQEQARSMMKGIRDLSLLQEEVCDAVKENSELVKQLQDLAVKLVSNGTIDTATALRLTSGYTTSKEALASQGKQ